MLLNPCAEEWTPATETLNDMICGLHQISEKSEKCIQGKIRESKLKKNSIRGSSTASPSLTMEGMSNVS